MAKKKGRKLKIESGKSLSPQPLEMKWDVEEDREKAAALLEEELVIWLEPLQEFHIPKPLFRDLVKMTCKKLSVPIFKPSEKWVTKFKEKHFSNRYVFSYGKTIKKIHRLAIQRPSRTLTGNTLLRKVEFHEYKKSVPIKMVADILKKNPIIISGRENEEKVVNGPPCDEVNNRTSELEDAPKRKLRKLRSASAGAKFHGVTMAVVPTSSSSTKMGSRISKRTTKRPHLAKAVDIEKLDKENVPPKKLRKTSTTKDSGSRLSSRRRGQRKPLKKKRRPVRSDAYKLLQVNIKEYCGLLKFFGVIKKSAQRKKRQPGYGCPPIAIVEEVVEQKMKRGRGRPRKIKPVEDKTVPRVVVVPRQTTRRQTTRVPGKCGKAPRRRTKRLGRGKNLSGLNIGSVSSFFAGPAYSPTVPVSTQDTVPRAEIDVDSVADLLFNIDPDDIYEDLDMSPEDVHVLDEVEDFEYEETSEGEGTDDIPIPVSETETEVLRTNKCEQVEQVLPPTVYLYDNVEMDLQALQEIIAADTMRSRSESQVVQNLPVVDMDNIVEDISYEALVPDLNMDLLGTIEPSDFLNYSFG